MPIDIYSKRKNAGTNTPDVYQYDVIPKALRVQIVHIWRRYIDDLLDSAKQVMRYRPIVKLLCEEYGVFVLNNAREKYNCHWDYDTELIEFILKEEDVDKVLDTIELASLYIDNEKADKEINHRFKEHCVGYEYTNKQIIRIDSQYIHSETVAPTLLLLIDPTYSGAEKEFLEAHKHYRHQDYGSMLNECLKAMESTLKIICDKRGWAYGTKDTAKKLLEACFNNNLIPTFWQSHFSAIRSCLESGVPTGRNKLSGHGSGGELRAIPQHIASFMLHETATSIKFFVDAEKSLP